MHQIDCHRTRGQHVHRVLSFNGGGNSGHMDSGRSKSKIFISLSLVTDQMVLIGFGLAAVDRLIDSFPAIFLSHDHFLQKMTGIDRYNAWGRVIVLCLIAIFGSHAQFTINEPIAAADKRERDAATRVRFRRLLSPDLAEMVVNGKTRERQPVNAKGKCDAIKAYAVLGHRGVDGQGIYKGIKPLKPQKESRS